MRQAYITKRFRKATHLIIQQAGEIIEEYAEQGFDLTLRQLYYQFVARGFLPNQQREYNRLSTIISDARLAGILDWNSIVDRTRFVRELSHWSSPASIISSAADSFRMDKWAVQEYRLEVWIEKDALVGVIEDVCERWDVPYFSCRGYVSQSSMWRAAQRMQQYAEDEQETVIIHLGDHDPSGIDMTRDIKDRHQLFSGVRAVTRIALNIDQVREKNPPPNPTKMTDTRTGDYSLKFGNSCWELDALEPTYISTLIEKTITGYVNMKKWNAVVKLEGTHRENLEAVAEHWNEVVDFVEDMG